MPGRQMLSCWALPQPSPPCALPSGSLCLWSWGPTPSWGSCLVSPAPSPETVRQLWPGHTYVGPSGLSSAPSWALCPQNASTATTASMPSSALPAPQIRLLWASGPFLVPGILQAADSKSGRAQVAERSHAAGRTPHTHRHSRPWMFSHPPVRPHLSKAALAATSLTLITADGTSECQEPNPLTQTRGKSGRAHRCPQGVHGPSTLSPARQ